MLPMMRKEDAIRMFGDVASLAAALGITRQAIYQWPDDLAQDQADRINGAALRVGVDFKVGSDSQERQVA